MGCVSSEGSSRKKKRKHQIQGLYTLVLLQEGNQISSSEYCVWKNGCVATNLYFPRRKSHYPNQKMNSFQRARCFCNSKKKEWKSFKIGNWKEATPRSCWICHSRLSKNKHFMRTKGCSCFSLFTENAFHHH
jgi:hypothetical protein